MPDFTRFKCIFLFLLLNDIFYFRYFSSDFTYATIPIITERAFEAIGT